MHNCRVNFDFKRIKKITKSFVFYILCFQIIIRLSIIQISFLRAICIYQDISYFLLICVVWHVTSFKFIIRQTKT